MNMILNLEATDKVFSSAIDINRLLISVFKEQKQVYNEIKEESVVRTIIPQTRYGSLEASIELESNNPLIYKKTKVFGFWCDVRADVKKSLAYPHYIWPKNYLPYSEFVELIPSKFKNINLKVGPELHESKITIIDFIGFLNNCAEVSDSLLFGVYREESTYGQNSDRSDQNRKILNMIISEQTPDSNTPAAIVINFVITEGKK